MCHVPLARRICLLILALMFFLPNVATAAIIEVGDLNIIDDAGNPSDGLRYLDLSISDGLSQADALTAAMALYPNARLATPDEFDDLFTAAGIPYNGALTASSAFDIGVGVFITNLFTPSVNALRLALGPTNASNADIWSLPDGSDVSTTTRDLITLRSDGVVILRQDTFTPPDDTIAWLIVSDPVAVVPEPSTFALLGIGGIALVGYGWRRKRQQAA